MSYVDGFLIAIKKKNLKAYKAMAALGCKIWREHGALDYKECIIDDAQPQYVTLTFPKLVKTKPGETVWFSFIVFKSRQHRDSVNKKVMAYFEKKYGNEMPMPFDMKRFSYGGFKVEVSA